LWRQAQGRAGKNGEFIRRGFVAAEGFARGFATRKQGHGAGKAKKKWCFSHLCIS
jgi:hypothetical protein